MSRHPNLIMAVAVLVALAWVPSPGAPPAQPPAPLPHAGQGEPMGGFGLPVCRNEMLPMFPENMGKLAEKFGGEVINLFEGIDSLESGQEKAYSAVLWEGVPYGVRLFATTGPAKDVDIYLFDDEGTQVASGETIELTETVLFTPAKTGTYRFIVKMAAGHGCYGIVILQGG